MNKVKDKYNWFTVDMTPFRKWVVFPLIIATFVYLIVDSALSGKPWDAVSWVLWGFIAYEGFKWRAMYAHLRNTFVTELQVRLAEESVPAFLGTVRPELLRAEINRRWTRGEW